MTNLIGQEGQVRKGKQKAQYSSLFHMLLYLFRQGFNIAMIGLNGGRINIGELLLTTSNFSKQ